jgi:RNA polymerase sigma-70 factor (ECF subfamily)
MDAAAMATHLPADAGLVIRARDGDADAFGQLLTARLSRMLRTARAIVGDDDDAAEVVQDTFISAWRHLPKLRDADRFDAWLHRALVNRCRDLLRQRRRGREIPLDAARLDERASDDPLGTDAVERAFGQLAVKDRAILIMHHLHEMPLTELARQLGIPVGTAKSRLWAARRALQRALEADA